jgi:hypothetical protein
MGCCPGCRGGLVRYYFTKVKRSSGRLADPYRDLDVIDARAPRFNQAVVGLLSVLAVATGWW